MKYVMLKAPHGLTKISIHKSAYFIGRYVPGLIDYNSPKKKYNGENVVLLRSTSNAFLLIIPFSAEKTELFHRTGTWRFGGGPRTVSCKTLVSVSSASTRKNHVGRLWVSEILLMLSAAGIH